MSSVIDGDGSILVVEDQFLIAELMKEEVEALGYRVLGPAPSVKAALRLLEEDLPTAALLDINLGNETVTPVAQRLTELDVPFAFLSAYARPGLLPEEFGDESYFKKPLSGGELAAALRALLSPGDA